MTAATAPFRAGSGELPPSSLDSEQAVLSAGMNGGAALDVARPILAAEDFYDDRHRRIYAAQLALRDAEWKVDPLTLIDELGRRGDLDVVGGKDYIGFLVDAVPTDANIEYHAQIVREKAILRGLIAAGEATARLAREGRMRSEEITERLIAGVSGLPGTRRRPLQLLDDLEIALLPPVQFLVADVIPAAAMVCIVGVPGAGKSFATLSLACCVATGERWMGLQLRRRGPVVYVGAEGSAGFSQRIDAWKHANGYDDVRIGVYFLPQPINLLVDVEREQLLAAIRRLPEAPALVVFDTLARAMAGGEENSAKDMGLVIENADRIRRQTGATILLVHHTRRDSDVERGSTSLRGAVDTLLVLKLEDERRVLVVDKQKDGPQIHPIPFELVPTLLSCVATVANDVRLEGGSLTGSLSGKLLASLRALSECALGGTASGTTWMEVSGIAKPSFYRYAKILISEGYVSVIARGNSKNYSLTESGKSALSHQSHTVSRPVSPGGVPQSHDSHPPLGGESVRRDAETGALELHLDNGTGARP